MLFCGLIKWWKNLEEMPKLGLYFALCQFSMCTMSKVVSLFSMRQSDLGFTAHRYYFTHFDLHQSQGGAKRGDPTENLPDNPQAEFDLSQMWPKIDCRWNLQQRELTTILLAYDLGWIQRGFSRVAQTPTFGKKYVIFMGILVRTW